ncbi:hypothetical protein AB0F24_01550 [Streptomyces platensis]|uniref:hypothetical protein n=1 Tax=Streptomyces platensis TaxID=58346 RepID=UPI0033D57191
MAQIVRANRLALARLMAVRLLIAGLLVAVPVVLSRVTGANAFFLALPIPVGVGVLIMTVWRAVYGIRVFQCEKVLRHYPLEFHPRVLMKRAKWTEYGDVHQIRVTTRRQHGAPLMLAINAVGRRRWPEGAEEGAWLAGDLLFGGVLVVPGSNAMLFLKPADWDKTARKREEAGAQRSARAQQAGLHQMTNRSWMMRIGT